MESATSCTLHVTLTATSPTTHLRVTAQPGDSVAKALWLSGKLQPAALCSGLGRCGACRVRFSDAAPPASDDERNILGESAILDGWRLGCRHKAQDGMCLEVPAKAVSEATSDESSCGTPRLAPGTRSLLLAVDLGTTSIQWRAVSPSGEIQAEGGLLNPQLGAGSDVMSRISMALAPHGCKRLQQLVVRALCGVISRLALPVSEMCVAGNTAMTAIFLGEDCSDLAAAPYRLTEGGGRLAQVSGLPPVWIPPQLSPFVGGDITAGMIATLANSPEFPFLFADMGTNGEFVLARDASSALVTSVPLGPALEGIGLRHGVMAEPGSITGFDFSPSGLSCRFWNSLPPEGKEATGITGTGYLSLLALLRKAEILRPDGHPATSGGSPFFQKTTALIRKESDEEWWMELPFGMRLTASDVEALLKVRAAFALAVCRLLEESQMRGENITWHLAGALGAHVESEAMERLGFIPSGLGKRLRPAGNASLEGATLFLTRKESRAKSLCWSKGCRAVDLTAQSDFMTAYVRAMAFQRMTC